MMFSKKKETVIPYSVEECGSCKAISKRKFKEGDYIFKNTDKCSSCNGQMLVVKVFGEVFKE